MAKARVKLDFILLSVAPKIQFVRDRVNDMTGNANFPTPDVALAIITTAVNDLETKFNLAQGGGPAQTAAQDASEEALDDLMREEAGYVTRIADGDVVKITSAGFTATQTEPSPIAIPDKVQNLILKHGSQSGTILTTCDPVEHAKGYVTVISDNATAPITVNNGSVVLQMATAPSPIPVPAPVGQNLFLLFNASSSRKALFSGLTSGTRYYCFKYAFNSKGKGADSDVVSIVAP
ncbi:MAG: hypothetical protein HY841_03550 [Bacteroidetes bacterium]|nr:hypothetical protein [Bacteroidota bacterium]